MKWLAALLVLLLTATLALGCEEEQQEPGGVASTPTVAATQTAEGTEVATPSSAPPADVAPEPTEVIAVQPSALSVVQEIEGHCWTGSLMTVRPDAWRCMEGDLIHDPCFSESDTDASVICPLRPPGHMTGAKMNLTEPLPVSYGHQDEDPSSVWFLELADGTTCILTTGATAVIGGERVNYTCSDGWWVVGLPEVDTVWTVHRVLMSPDSDQPTAEAEAAVATAWR